MAEIQFPTSPLRDDEHTDANGVVWVCNDSTTSGDAFTSWGKKGSLEVHNDLSGLQGGIPNDYQHLTTVEKDKLTGIQDAATVSNLGNTPSSTDLIVTNSGGSDTTLPGASTSLAGVMSGVDKTKLNSIESGATADMTGAQIKVAYENEANTNAYTDTEKSKLGAIESGATADQTKSDIDALGIDAETLDGLDSTAFALAGTGGISNVVEDTSPQLGGTLDCNGQAIKGSSYIAMAKGTGGGSYGLDYASGDYRHITANANFSISYSNFIAGQVCGFIIDAVNFGAYTVTWPVGTKFAAGAAPSFTAAGLDRLLLFKDADNIYTVHVVDQDIK